MVMEKALSREARRGCGRSSRLYPPLALGVGTPSAGLELNCACAACVNSREERIPEHKLRKDIMVRPYGKDVASISSTSLCHIEISGLCSVVAIAPATKRVSNVTIQSMHGKNGSATERLLQSQVGQVTKLSRSTPGYSRSARKAS